MNRFIHCSLFPLFAGLITIAAAADPLQNWPQWRGPLASGFAPQADPPLEWSETRNVKWKVPIPGFGSATPAVWGDRIFVLTAVRSDGSTGPDPQQPTSPYKFTVLCLDRKNGKTLWQKVAMEKVPHEGHHESHGFASASPITDGEVVLAYFGSRGLHCYDMDGNLKWQKDFGAMKTKMGFGEGASPALFGNTVVLNWDDETDNDFIIALDKHDGHQLWRTPRNEGTGWSTPLIVEHAGKREVVVSATGKVRSYDFATGQQTWEIGGQSPNAIPSPVCNDGVVYLTSGFRGHSLYAIKLGATGDLTGTPAVLWSYSGENTPYVPSPLLVDNLLYLVRSNDGLLSCFDAKTGKPQFEGEKLPGIFSIYASPVASKDRVFVMSREGVCLVLKSGPKLEVLATNKLNDKTDASIALVGKELFIRGSQNLYCIGQD